MTLDEAILLLRTAVKHTGTIDQKHIDLTVVPAEERGRYEKAMAKAQLSIVEGKISRDEFLKKVHIDS